MPIAQKILLTVPTVPLGIILVVIAVAASALMLFTVKRLIPREILGGHGEITASIFESVGMAYTVMLAFMVVVSWQNFDRTSSHVASEANELVDIYRDSEAFAPDFTEKVRAALTEYRRLVIAEEWPLMSKGLKSENVDNVLLKLWNLYSGYEPGTENENVFFAESVSNLNDLRQDRNLRIMDSRTGVNPVLWFILIIGAFTTILVACLFDADNILYNLLVISILATVIMLVIMAVLLFDYPFTGDVKIPAEMYTAIASF
jgi:hypothetical protein